MRATDVARADPGSVSTTALVDGITAFGHDLYANVAAKAASGNIVISPLSIAVAMSMARAGAGGSTASEIDAALHFPESARDAAINALTRDLATRDTAPPIDSPSNPAPSASADIAGGWTPKPPILTIANGLFVQQGQQIGAPFLHTIAADYGSGVRTVDFGSASATQQINAWVEKQTAGRIDRLFDVLSPATRLVLANAVYLKADWATPFMAGATKDAAFTRADGSTVRTPTMHETTSLGYADGGGWQAVEIPYAGDTLAMWVILPSGSTPLAELLTPPTLLAIRNGLKPSAVNLSLPRWDFATNVELKPALQQLGVHAAFTSAADFAGISRSLYISAAIHRANITVDEWGTEAAAVTGLAFAAGAIMPQ
ncbi:MAG: serpin family protein, partial [bacterium]